MNEINTRVQATTDQNFEREVLGNPGLTVVDFWAPWCAPCKALGPVVERIAETYEGRLRVAKLDVDANPSIPSRFNIRSVPTLLFFRDGALVDSAVGALPESKLVEKIEALLG